MLCARNCWRSLAAEIHPDKLGVLYPGIDFDALEAAASADLPREVYDWLKAGEGMVVVVAAMLRPEKGHLCLLEAACQAKAQGANLRYVFAGEGVMREQIEARIREKALGDSVLLAGMVRNIAPLLQRAGLVVVPSTVEPLGMTQIESLYLSTPVIASRVGGIPETIEDGVTGMLVSPGNASELTAAILDVLARPMQHRQMAACGKKSVVSRFSIKANLQALAAHGNFLLPSSQIYTRDLKTAVEMSPKQ